MILLIELLVAVSVIVAFVLGILGFTKEGMRFSGKSRKSISSKSGKIVGTILLIYAVGMVMGFVLLVAQGIIE